MSDEKSMAWVISEIESIKRRMGFQERLETPIVSDWQDYTGEPTGSSGSKGTFAYTEFYSRYCTIRNTCLWWYHMQLTDLGSWSGQVIINYPIASAGIPNSDNWELSPAIFAKGVSPTTPKASLRIVGSSTTLKFFTTISTNTTQWTDLAVNDIFMFFLAYEI